jgi:hypothetical protein
MRHRSILLLVAMLAVGVPLFGYTVYLTDGSHFQARGPYEVRDDQAIITLPNGTRTSIDLSQIDVERTRRANAAGHAGALVMETPEPPRAEPAPERPQLSDVAGQRRLGDRLTQQAQSAQRSQAASESSAHATSSEMPRTATGAVDLLRFHRVGYSDLEVGAQISRHLRARGLEGVAIYEWTRPGHVFLEFSTNSEAAVFRALQFAAETLLQVHGQGDVEAFELFMATDRQERAGQFLMTPEKAVQLTTRELDVPTFFVRYAQF